MRGICSAIYGAGIALTSFDRRSEDICVLPVIIPKLKFGDVQMQIFLANLVIGSDNATLQDGPEALNRIGVNCANDMLTGGVVNGLMRETAIQPLTAGICVGAEKADAVRYGLPHEVFESKAVCAFDHAGDDIALALDRAHYRSLAGVSAPALTAFLVPMPVFIATADVGFVNLNDSAEFLDVLDHGGPNLVAHEPSGFVGAKAHIAEDLKGAHALLADQHQVRDSVPIFQRLIRVLKDCAGQLREAIACGASRSALSALPMMARGQRIDLGVTATRTSDAMRPTAGHEIHNAIVLSFKQRIELGRCHLMDCFRAGHTNYHSMDEIFA